MARSTGELYTNQWRQGAGSVAARPLARSSTGRHGAQFLVAQFRAIERDVLFALPEFRDDRLELFLDVLITVAVEQMAEQPAAQVRGTHEPVGDGEGEVHVVFHHDSPIVMGRMVAANGVDERHVAHEPVFPHMAAVMEGFVDEVLRDHRQEHDVARVGVEHQGGQVAERGAHYAQGRQHPPGEKDDTEFPGGVDGRFDVGEILVVLARMAFVDGTQREDVDALVHHVAVHEPFDEIAGDEHRNDQQPFPAGALYLRKAVPGRRKAHCIHHRDMQQAVVVRADIGFVLFTEFPLAFGHHGGVLRFLLLYTTNILAWLLAYASTFFGCS